MSHAELLLEDDLGLFLHFLEFFLELFSFSKVCKLGALQKARLRKIHFSGDFLGYVGGGGH